MADTPGTAGNGPFDLSRTPIHIGTSPGSSSPTIPQLDFTFDGPSFERYIAAHCTSDAPGRLLMVETTPTNWGTWERHPQGDEIVIVLAGRADFIQEINGQPVALAVSAGSTLVNPAGVWHTADVHESLEAIYITPCPGTEHRPR